MTGEPAPARVLHLTIWEEYTDLAFVVANSLILPVTSAVGIAANIFVILAVYRQKSLQTSNNALVVNLAVIDILRCAVDCPILLTIVLTVYQRRHVDKLICDAQVASFSFSCCIQLLTLACISADRYQAIAQPFKSLQRRRRIMVLIPVTWTLAIVVAVFCLIFVKDSPVHMRCEGPRREISASYDTFGLYMLFPLWAACFGVIIGFYTRIFTHVRSHNRKIFDKGTFRLSKLEQTQDKQVNVGTSAVDNGHEKSEQKQTLSKRVVKAGPETEAEPNSSMKESPAAHLTSTEAPQCVLIGSDNKNELLKALEITDLEREQPRPSAEQVTVQNDEKPFKPEKTIPSAKKLEAQLSNGGAAAGRWSSAPKTQKVSSNFDTEKQSKERVKSDNAPSEMKESSPHAPPSAPLQNPEATSLSLIEPKQTKNNSGEESSPAATVAEGSSLPAVSSNFPDTEAAKQSVEAEGPVCLMPSKERRERASKKKESKMAKRAGYIIITFLIFWLPLITTILVNFIVNKNKNTQVRMQPYWHCL